MGLFTFMTLQQKLLSQAFRHLKVVRKVPSSSPKT